MGMGMERLTNWHRFLLLLFALGFLANTGTTLAQDSVATIEDAATVDGATNYVRNGSFEDSENNGDPLAPWFGTSGSLDSSESVAGGASAVVDTREANLAESSFRVLNQRIDPQPLLGKRIRFSASVKTAHRSEGGKAMLWVRVDRKDSNGNVVPVAFDNMQDRPITSDEWGRYEIVVDVAEDASSIVVGMIVSGKAQAWIDDARLEIVDENVEKTGQALAAALAGQATGPGSSVTPVYSHWMWLALFAIGLMFLSQMPNSGVQRFALKFTFLYWLLYIFHKSLLQIVFGIIAAISNLTGREFTWLQGLGSTLYQGVNNTTRTLAEWVASNVLQVELPPPVLTGSGDTAYDWVCVFMYFLFAIVGAVLWSFVWRSDKEMGRLRDALRSGLRYSLALTLMGYGLHKAGFISTQFLSQGMSQEIMFDQKFGDFSPMGLLWAFMRASTTYTFFAGLLEVVPAVLLIFRRTATFGAAAAIAVMANVFLLNMCYDVPVKQFSFHLMIMGCLILAPELPRIMNLLFWNRTTEPSGLIHQQFFRSKTGIWVHRIAKTVIVVMCFAIPITTHTYREVTYVHNEKKESQYLLLNRGFRWVAEMPYNR